MLVNVKLYCHGARYVNAICLSSINAPIEIISTSLQWVAPVSMLATRHAATLNILTTSAVEMTISACVTTRAVFLATAARTTVPYVVA